MAEDREHGFTTREEWQSFFHAYFQRIDEINELAFAITVGNTSFEDWLFSYKKQAQTIHELYMENNQYLKRHVSYFLDTPNAWNEEIAEPLISYLFRYCIRFQDIEVAYRLAQSLLAFYENKGNEIAVMKCYFVMITCFSSLDMVHYRDEILSLCEQGIKLYEKQYAHLTQEEKSMGLSIFDFESIAMYEFLRPAGDITQTFDTILYPAYERRMHALHAFLKEADGSAEYNPPLPYMKTCWINTFTAILVRLQRNTLSPDRVKKLYAISRKQYEFMRFRASSMKTGKRPPQQLVIPSMRSYLGCVNIICMAGMMRISMHIWRKKSDSSLENEFLRLKNMMRKH